jgi:cytochrome d ubiquinol oxidase subunit I
VPGTQELLKGGYTMPSGEVALSAREKMARGKEAIAALKAFRTAKERGDEEAAALARTELQEKMPYFGYGYLRSEEELIPNIPLNFYAFRAMVGLGSYFILFFAVVLFLNYKQQLERRRWLLWVGVWSIPLAYLASQAGWIVAEVGRQPWAIQDLLPVSAAVSRLQTGSVQLTFYLFLILFTLLLAAEIRILLKAIQKGAEGEIFSAKV